MGKVSKYVGGKNVAVRINGLTTATSIEADDYVVIDGATSGTRKALVSDVGGENMIDFTSSLTPSIDSRGVTAAFYQIFPADSADITMENALKIRGYLANTSTVSYPLILTYAGVGATAFSVQFKSIYGNPQNTTSTTISGTLHIIAPFEISSISASM